MIFEVGGKQVFAATGGQPVRTDRPVAVFLHGAGGEGDGVPVRRQV